jgi:hypothetical protein
MIIYNKNSQHLGSLFDIIFQHIFHTFLLFKLLREHSYNTFGSVRGSDLGSDFGSVLGSDFVSSSRLVDRNLIGIPPKISPRPTPLTFLPLISCTSLSTREIIQSTREIIKSIATQLLSQLETNIHL